MQLNVRTLIGKKKTSYKKKDTNIISQRLIISIICLMGISSQFASDSYVPSLPYIAEYFDASYKLIEFTISAYFIGMGFATIFSGQLSDMFGIKRILLLGYCIFIVASFFCLISSSENELIFFRFLQGIGMGCPLVLFRVVMLNTFQDRQSLTKASLIITSIVSFTPPLSPISGGIIQSLLGWRYNFVLMLIIGILTAILIKRYLHDTSSKKQNIKNHFFYSYIKLLKNLNFMLNACCAGFALSITFIFITVSPYFFQIELNYNALQYSIIASAIILPSAIVMIILRKYISEINMRLLMICCAIISIMGGIFLIFTYYIFGLSAICIALGVTIIFMGNTFQYTAAYVSAYQNVKTSLGIACSLYSLIQIMITSLFTGIVAYLGIDSQEKLGMIIIIPAIFIFLIKILHNPVSEKASSQKR